MSPRNLLLKLGIRSNIKGFRYLQYGLEKCMENEDYLFCVFRDLYPVIAEKFSTTRDGVEHCIRTAVDNCWYKGNRKFLIEIAGYEELEKPCNKDFIDILYHYLERSDMIR